MNALSINIPANFIATCESTLAKYSAAQTDAERRAIGFVGKLHTTCMSEKELRHAIRLTRFRGAVCPVFQA